MIQYAGPLLFNSSFTKYWMPAFAGMTTEASATGASYELRGAGDHLRRLNGRGACDGHTGNRRHERLIRGLFIASPGVDICL
jgi:hypothetical protein